LDRVLLPVENTQLLRELGDALVWRLT